MNFILAVPTSEDLIHLLKAWRYWLLGAVAGALLGVAIYLVAPPAYRARATVNVDFHMEQAWPQNSDREEFYYLEREARKLEDIAMSDAVLNAVVPEAGGLTLAQLRGGTLQLSQPGNGGWHFYADDRDADRAGRMVSAWANAFMQAVQTQVAQPSSSLEHFITTAPVETQSPRAHRAVSMAVYMLSGASVLLALTALGILFLHRQG